MPKPLIVWITINCGKFLKRWEYLTTLPASQETCTQVKKQQLELDMEQLTDSKLGKEYIKAIYCHLTYLTSMQGTSWKILGWMNHRLESGLSGEISPPQICRWYHSNGRNWRGTKESLDEGERGEWESLLETWHSKNWDHGIRSHHFMANRGGKSKQWQILFSWAPKPLQMVTATMKLNMLAPWKKSYDKPRQCIRKQRCNFADKDHYSQNYDFSSSHVYRCES